MHGGFWQFGVLVVATSHQPPPPAAVDFYPPHPALLEPNFLVLWLSGWLLAGWLPPCPSLSLSLMSVLSISMHPLLSRFSSRLLSLPLLRSRSLHLRAAVSSALVKIHPPYLHVQHALGGHEHGLQVTIGVHQRVSAFE